MDDTAQLTVRNNTEDQQYELFADQLRLGLAQYQETPGTLAFIHTEIAPEASGQGLGSVLIKAALDDARTQGLTVLPYCSFVRHYIETHPAYLDLVPADRRAAFAFPADADMAAAQSGDVIL